MLRYIIFFVMLASAFSHAQYARDFKSCGAVHNLKYNDRNYSAKCESLKNSSKVKACFSRRVRQIRTCINAIQNGLVGLRSQLEQKKNNATKDLEPIRKLNA